MDSEKQFANDISSEMFLGQTTILFERVINSATMFTRRMIFSKKQYFLFLQYISLILLLPIACQAQEDVDLKKIIETDIWPGVRMDSIKTRYLENISDRKNFKCTIQMRYVFYQTVKHEANAASAKSFFFNIDSNRIVSSVIISFYEDSTFRNRIIETLGTNYRKLAINGLSTVKWKLNTFCAMLHQEGDLQYFVIYDCHIRSFSRYPKLTHNPDAP